MDRDTPGRIIGRLGIMSKRRKAFCNRTVKIKMMFFAVTDVKPLNNYLLHLTFKNGEQKIFDMKPYLETGIFWGLKDEDVFKTVKVSFDTVEWSNEADIDPETLYGESKIISI